jgi:hypothetical protein
MGWSIGFDTVWNRDIGYGVPATCDHHGCGANIDRGISYVCGGEPYGGEHGCGLYFCEVHRQVAGQSRHNVELCSRCYSGKPPFTPTADRVEWVQHKLTDESWLIWRMKNPAAAAQLLIGRQGGAQ